MRGTIVAIVLATGCSLGTPQPDDCASTDECRAAFGAAFTCNPTSGLCESAMSDVCPDVFPVGGDEEPDAILFGTIFDRSSPNQLARERAARLAVSGINLAGGIDGRTVVLIHCDTSLGSATDAADTLVAAGVPAIIGPSSSSDTQAVFSSHSMDGVLVISPSATATQLEDIDTSTPGLLWRTAPPDTLQSTVIMRDITALGATSIVIIRRSGDVYAQSLSVILQAAAMADGLTVGTGIFPDAAGIPTAATAALTAVGATPDVVVFLSSQVADAAAFLDATAGMTEYDAVGNLFFPDAAANEDLFTRTTSGSARYPQVRATRPAAPSTIITSEFVAEYMSANGGEDPLQFSFTAHTYDAAALVLLGAGFAVDGGAALTATGIAEGIERMSAGTAEHQLLGSNFISTIAALRTDPVGVDVVGASGPLDYDATTEELTSATYEILTIATGGMPSFTVADTISVP